MPSTTVHDILEFTISQRFVPALLNVTPAAFADRNCTVRLTRENVDQLRAFLRSVHAALPRGVFKTQWSVAVLDCTRSATCAITGRYAYDVSDVVLEYWAVDSGQ